MKFSLVMFFAVLATPALAHPLHIIDLAGHNHWAALAGLSAVALAALLAKGKAKSEDADAGEEEPDAEPQEA
jgi:hypothetical protein